MIDSFGSHCWQLLPASNSRVITLSKIQAVGAVVATAHEKLPIHYTSSSALSPHDHFWKLLPRCSGRIVGIDKLQPSHSIITTTNINPAVLQPFW
jgi:hypothetical protein